MRQTAAEDEDEEEEDRMEEGVEDVVKLSRTKNADRRWKTTLPNIYGMSVPEFQPPPLKPVPADSETPYDFFCLFVSDEFVDKITASSKLYAAKKNRPDEAAKINSNSMHPCYHVSDWIFDSCKSQNVLGEETGYHEHHGEEGHAQGRLCAGVEEHPLCGH